MRGVLPDDIIDRRKQGFAVPLAKWFRGELSTFARDLLFSQPCRDRGLFNGAYIDRLLQLHERGRDIDLQLWTLLSLELWCRRVLDAPIQTIETPARATGQRILPAVFAAASWKHGKSRRAPALRYDQMTNTKPRVALVAASLDILGGQGVQAQSLIEALRDDGYDVTFLPINPAFPRGLQWMRRVPGCARWSTRTSTCPACCGS